MLAAILSSCGTVPVAAPIAEPPLATSSVAVTDAPHIPASPPSVDHAGVSSQPSMAPPAPSDADKAAALRAWVREQRRIYRVAAPLLINNAEFCPQHARQVLGFTAKNMYSYSDAFIDIARSALGLGEDLQIMDVLPGSGAEQVGLREGDVLLAVEIEPMPKGAEAEREAAELIGSEMRGRTSLRMGIRRDGQHIRIDVPLTSTCAMAMDLGNAMEPLGFADGQRVMITRGMLDFVQSDQELAYVLAREMARNETMTEGSVEMRDIIDRLHSLDASTLSGDVPDALNGAMQSYAKDMDSDTGRLALKMLARAGYDIADYQAFWQRLATRLADGINTGAPAVARPETVRLSALDRAARGTTPGAAGELPHAQ